MRKMNWSCTACGMSAGRKFSVQRHINNPNIHNGFGQVVSYLEYSIGIREGKYRLEIMPQFTSVKTPYLKKIEAEVENQIVREVARRIYNQLTANQLFLNNLERVVSDYIASKNFNDILKEANL